MNTRYDELDTLRGFAAITVLFSHLMLVFQVMQDDTYSKGITFVNILKYSPIHFFWGGSEAVIFFFILSGFVLSMQFFAKSYDGYSKFIVKRICRIYIPYIIAIVIAFILRELTHHGTINNVSEWFNGNWSINTTPKLIIHHILLLGSYPTTAYNPAIWSLIYEMRISIIFPLLMIIVVKSKLSKNLIICFSFSLITYILLNVSSGKGYNYIITLHYIALFLIGVLIAQHRIILISIFKKLNRNLKCCLLFMGLLLYTSRWTFYKYIFTYKLLNEYLIALGVFIFICMSISSPKISLILKNKCARFIGKISYSFYLYHMIVLFALVNMFNNVIPLWIILLLTIIVSFTIAALSYYFVEIPSIRLGKTICKHITSKNLTKCFSIEKQEIASK